MVTEIILRSRCDLCSLVEEGQGTIRPFPIVVFNKALECDLCEECRVDKIKALSLGELVAVSRPPANAVPPKGSRQRSKGAIPLERSEDGKYHCPLCPDVAYQANSAVRYHLKSRHPEEEPNYRIVGDKRPPAPKERTSRTATTKKAPARRGARK